MAEYRFIDYMPCTGGMTRNEKGGADAEALELLKKIRNAKDGIKTEGTTYYVSPEGDDSNCGTSPDQAMASFRGVEGCVYCLKPGDSVLFKRGGEYRLNFDLNLISGVTYGAYGEGEKPVVNGSYMNYAKADIWKNHEGNIWKIPYFPHTDAGIMVFDSGKASGNKRGYVAKLEKNFDFSHDLDNHVLYLYCDKGNPGEVFDDIEIGQMTRLFHISRELKDITIDNLSFKYTGLFAIRSDGECENITITNCEFSWLGGSMFPNLSNRFGNAIEFSSGADNVRIENCHFNQIYDAAATFQIGEAAFRNFTVRGNLFEYTGMGGFEWWTNGAKDKGLSAPVTDIPVENILIENNIFRMNGYGWSDDTRYPCHIRGTWGFQDYSNLKNFRIINNIFDCSYMYIMAVNWTAVPNEYILKGNRYYQKPTKKLNPEDKGYPQFDVEHGKPTFANNQEEFLAAVELVEKEHGEVKWIED